jgi:hypothetical protein
MPQFPPEASGFQKRRHFRRALKTRDLKLAYRRLDELRAKLGGLRISADAKLTFAQAGKMWLEARSARLIATSLF